MSRYIDIDAITKYMNERYNNLCEMHGEHDSYTTGYGDGIFAIEQAPIVDVVKVVRCADCRYYNSKWNTCGGQYRAITDYCSDGRRRENETN